MNLSDSVNKILLSKMEKSDLIVRYSPPKHIATKHLRTCDTRQFDEKHRYWDESCLIIKSNI